MSRTIMKIQHSLARKIGSSLRVVVRDQNYKALQMDLDTAPSLWREPHSEVQDLRQLIDST